MVMRRMYERMSNRQLDILFMLMKVFEGRILNGLDMDFVIK